MKDTRERILDAAKESFIKNGFHSAGIREIAFKANISPSYIYKQFRNKDDLIKVIIDEFHSNVNEAINYYIKGDVLYEELINFFTFYIKEGAKKTSLALTIEIYSEAIRNKNILKIVKKSEKYIVSQIENALVRDGCITKLTKKDTARILMSTADSYSMKTVTEEGFSKKNAIESMTDLISLLIEK